MVKKLDLNYTRANQVMDGRRRRIFEECKAVIEANSIKGFEHSLDAHGDFIVDQAVAIAHNINERFMVNVVNNGIFSNMDDDMIIETFGTIGKDGAKVQSSIEIPPFYREMMFSQNAYEKLTVDAALEGSYDKALKALTLNATVPSVEKAKEILDAFIEVNKGYFPELR